MRWFPQRRSKDASDSPEPLLPSDPAFFDYPDDPMQHRWTVPDIRVRRYDDDGKPQPVSLRELVRLTHERSDLHIDGARLEVQDDDKWFLAFELSDWVAEEIRSGQRNLIDHVEFEVISRIAKSEDLGQWAADVREYVQRAPLAAGDGPLDDAIAEDTQTISQWFHEISATTSPSVGQQPPPSDPLVDGWGYGTRIGR